jgi:uncharacterized protein (DUF2126 family)
MSIRVALKHKTEYKFDRFVSLSPHTIRLSPAPHTRTPILSRSMEILPKGHFINWQQDPYSNYFARVIFPEKAKELSIDVNIVVEMVVINPFDFFVEPYGETYPFRYEKTLAFELKPFLETETPGPKLHAYLETISRRELRTIDFLVGINQRLQKDIKYLIRPEPGVQTCEETLTLRRGSCRDSAWLLAQIFRNLGLAARFVSGYLIQLAPDEKPADGSPALLTDFTDLHAWTEVYLPGAGWIGLDPTSGLFAGEGHIPLACTAEPSTAAPVSGLMDKCESEFNVSMTVTRIRETPRITWPYPEEVWTQIDALGRKVDADLKFNDVRLTMGGEPTFVGMDNADDPEWNSIANSAKKKAIGDTLIKRLRERFAAGGLLHYGQGKWYPGEPLPRWALSCYWRKDGVPMWNRPELIADLKAKSQFNSGHALKFMQALTARLNIDPKFAIPAYEDVWQYLLKERQLPANVDPLDNRLDDAETRKRIAQIFEQGLGSIVGYALPIENRQTNEGTAWMSGPWFLRREHLYLLPGDSPMGFRLPLDSLPWVPKDDRAFYEADPYAIAAVPLPQRLGEQPLVRGIGRDWRSHSMQWPRPQGIPDQTLSSQGTAERSKPGSSQESGRKPSAPQSADIIRTALCIEPRLGHLHVFMPPQRYLEDYLHLVAALEESARVLEMPVVIEGYTPPADARLNQISVTPDPGVLEVNVHPAANWEELTRNTEVVYEEARNCRLQAVKYMVDGRQVGTGGGNHIIVGGATPADSPILRRPDVLRSLISFWHNHPSLSYLFSGLFIGPTSQHPRMDEARTDSVHELELAFKQIPDPGYSAQPWLIDRVLRNLLIDASGNTHRSEFCIDKLFSPDSSSGRLGLVEIRAFEMPPHHRMSLAQQLLVRAMLASFWQQPYNQRLVRWGTQLHDRFMLPHFVGQDFHDVLFEMNQRGYALKSEWFKPHHEFRFPTLGKFVQQGIHVELRQALEPWHVLGEESSAGGAVRRVDSSLERIQVKVNGMTDGRHTVICNDHALPLHPTGTNGEFVAGVRYRAWRPPECLHPTIPIHAPLSIDVFDAWNNRPVGGCTYYVSHPGGRHYDDLPVNANSAEARCAARFTIAGQRPLPGEIIKPERNPEFPFTLDLRRSKL